MPANARTDREYDTMRILLQTATFAAMLIAITNVPTFASINTVTDTISGQIVSSAGSPKGLLLAQQSKCSKGKSWCGGKCTELPC
jgi:hypothetical protein